MKNKTTERNIILETLRRIFFISSKLPKTAQIEVTNRCNLDCKMCPREHLNVEYKDMDFELFKILINKLKGVSEIILMGWGEPLIHPQIAEMIQYSHNAGFKTRLTSNAVLLNDKNINKIINTGLDEITFSIDSVHSSDFGHTVTSQVENIKNFANKFPLFPITLQTTIYKNREEEIFGIIKFANKIKAKINIGRLDMRFNNELKRPNFKEEKSIVLKLVEFGDKQGVLVNCMYHSIDKGFKRFAYKLIKGLLHQGGRYCLRIHDYIYVDLKGNIIPCGYLYKYNLGSLLKEDLKDIWHSKKNRQFRENQKKICKKCDMFQIKHHINN